MKGCAGGQKLGNGVTWYVLNVRHVLAACKCFYQCGVNYYYAGFSMFDALPQGLFKLDRSHSYTSTLQSPGEIHPVSGNCPRASDIPARNPPRKGLISSTQRARSAHFDPA